MSQNSLRRLPDSSFFESTPSRASRSASRASIPVSLISEVIPEWLLDIDGQSPRTVEGKKDILEKFLWWLQREKIVQCSRVEVKRFLNYVANAHETEPLGRWDNGIHPKTGLKNPHHFRAVSERTIQLYFVYIRGYFDYLYEEEFIDESPVKGMKRPSATKRSPKPLEVETDVVALIAAAFKGKAPRRDVALLYFFLDTGVRVSELCGIKLKDVDWARGVVRVIGKGNKEREVCFERETGKVIKSYVRACPCEQHEPLFRSEGGHTPGEEITRQGVAQILTRLAVRAGLAGKQVSPHVFRHTFATEFSKLNGSAKALQMQLGHSTMDMTLIYVQMAEADTKNQHRRASPARLLGVASKKR